jgi:uncharacterized membrane protein (DUF485 family)
MEAVVRISAILSCVGLFISSLEMLSTKTMATGRFSSAVLYNQGAAKFTRLVIGNEKNQDALAKGLLLLRIIACISCILACLGSSKNMVFPIAIIIVSNLTFSLLKQVGNDGADQMNNIVFISLLFGCLFSGTSIQPVVLFFICGQTLLSYFTAGVAKFISPVWMKTNAVGSILGSLSYGHRGLYYFLQKREVLGRIISVFIVFFEMLFPLCIFLPQSFCLCFLAIGLFFHLNCAIVMGLNDFVWAFAATYPSVYWVCLYLNLW